MELHYVWNSEPQNIEQEISNDEVWNRCAQSFFNNINDRIPYFDIRYSLFDIRFFRVSFSIRLADFQTSGDAYICNRMRLSWFHKGLEQILWEPAKTDQEAR